MALNKIFSKGNSKSRQGLNRNAKNDHPQPNAPSSNTSKPTKLPSDSSCSPSSAPTPSIGLALALSSDSATTTSTLQPPTPIPAHTLKKSTSFLRKLAALRNHGSENNPLSSSQPTTKSPPQPQQLSPQSISYYPTIGGNTKKESSPKSHVAPKREALTKVYKAPSVPTSKPTSPPKQEEDSEFNMSSLISPYLSDPKPYNSHTMRDKSPITLASPPSPTFFHAPVLSPVSPCGFSARDSSTDVRLGGYQTPPNNIISSASNLNAASPHESLSQIPNIDDICIKEVESDIISQSTKQLHPEPDAEYKLGCDKDFNLDTDLISPTSRYFRTSCLNDPYTEEGTISDANIQIYKAYKKDDHSNLKFISTSSPMESPIESPVESPVPQYEQFNAMPSSGATHDHNTDSAASPSALPRPHSVREDRSCTAQRLEDRRSVSEIISDSTDESNVQVGLKSESILEQASNSSSLSIANDDELEFSNYNEVLHDELLSIVKEHQIRVAKQQQEIDHLKHLLREERKFNSILSSSPVLNNPKGQFNSRVPSINSSSNNSDECTITKSAIDDSRHPHKRRSGFLPIKFVIQHERKHTLHSAHDAELRQSSLLPPFRIPLDGPNEKEDSQHKPRNQSVSSQVSSVMSTSHQDQEKERPLNHHQRRIILNKKHTGLDTRDVSESLVSDSGELEVINDYYQDSASMYSQSLSFQSHLTTPDILMQPTSGK